MVSVSGIRGRVGEALTPEVVDRYAAGFGAWALARSMSREIVVARDSRVSGPMFHRVVVAALQSVGATIVDLDMAPTPTVQLTVEDQHAAGGLAITASHNPIEWNALKFIGSTGLFLDPADSAAMRAFVDRGFTRVTWDKLGVLSRDEGAIAVTSTASSRCRCSTSKPFANGISRWRSTPATAPARPSSRSCWTRLGCEVEGINLEPDGLFHRPPEPVAENLGELSELVRRTGSVIGFATDPDVDRLALVDDTGGRSARTTRWPSPRAWCCADSEVRWSPTSSTSRIVDDMAAEYGSEVIRAPVGEVNVAVRMRDEGAVIGGEGQWRRDSSRAAPWPGCPAGCRPDAPAAGRRGTTP